MINLLITGDFCVGKDLVADMIINGFDGKSLLYKTNPEDLNKIVSYTTRNPRYDGEDTHIFCTKDEFLSFNDFVAQTKIGDEYYGARASQFLEDKINIYIVDNKGVVDMYNSDLENIFVIKVSRPKWLRDCPEQRLNRTRYFEDEKIPCAYYIMNDGDKHKLATTIKECLSYLEI